MILRTLQSVLMSAALVFPCLAAADSRDLLDTPALKARLAERSLLNGVAVAGGHIVGVGQRGHILVSKDRGKSWRQAEVPVSSDLVAVHFPTDKNGWAVGHDGVVLHSADGGLSWEKQFDGRAAARVMVDYYAKAAPKGGNGSPAALQGVREDARRYLAQGADKPFLDVWFENESDGYVVGAFGLLFRTGDGGKSWVPWFDRIDNPKRAHLYAIRRVCRELYIAGEQGSLFKLDAGTKRFKAIKTPYAGTFFGITGANGVLIAFGMRGTVFRSADGGLLWRKVEVGVPIGLTGAAVTPDGRIVLVNQAGHLLVSGDGGQSFALLKTGRPAPAGAVATLERDTVVLVGLNGVALQSIKQ